MFKNILLSSIACSAFLISGCASVPEPKKTVTKCVADNEGNLECSVEVTWQKNSGNFDSMQQLVNEDIAIDFTSSQRALMDQPFGYNMNDGMVTLKNNGSVVAVRASAYTKQGQRIVAQDGQDMSSWLSTYNGQADEIVLEVVNLKFETQTGPNTVTAEVTHNGNVLSGSSTSYYRSETDSIGNN